MSAHCHQKSVISDTLDTSKSLTREAPLTPALRTEYESTMQTIPHFGCRTERMSIDYRVQPLQTEQPLSVLLKRANQMLHSKSSVSPVRPSVTLKSPFRNTFCGSKKVSSKVIKL